MNNATLEGRLQQLEDRQSLSDLVTRYEIALDDRDIDALMNLFTADARFHLAPGAGAELASGPDIRGRDNLRTFYSDRIRNYSLTLHYHHSQMIEFESESVATGVVMSHAEIASDGDAVIGALRYYDAYRREGDGWKFAERVTRFWYDMRMSDLPERLGDPLRLRWPHEPTAAQLPESIESFRRFHGL